MKTNVPMLLILLSLLIIPTCKNGCKVDPIGGTRETGDKAYSGRENAVSPYAETKWVRTMEHGECKPQGCTYSVLARVMLHNPLPVAVTANVDCSFTLGDGYEFGKNHRGGVKVGAKRSKGVELQQMVQVTPGKADSIGATCTVMFK